MEGEEEVRDFKRVRTEVIEEWEEWRECFREVTEWRWEVSLEREEV